MSNKIQKVEVKPTLSNLVEDWEWSQFKGQGIDSEEIPLPETALDIPPAEEFDPNSPEGQQAKVLYEESRSVNRRKYQRFASKIIRLAELGMDPEMIGNFLGVPETAIKDSFAREVKMGLSRLFFNAFVKLQTIANTDGHKGQMQALLAIAKHAGLKDVHEVKQVLTGDADVRKITYNIMASPTSYAQARKLLHDLERSESGPERS